MDFKIPLHIVKELKRYCDNKILMMTKIKKVADIVYFSVKKVVDCMIIKWDFQVIGNYHKSRI